MNRKFEINNLFIDAERDENYTVKHEINAVTDFKFPPSLENISPAIARVEIGEEVNIIPNPDTETE